MKTQYEALEEFRQELLDYTELDAAQDADPMSARVEQGRREACRAHAIRVDQIMAADPYQPGYVGAEFGPGDAAVVVSVPSGYAPTLFRFDREGFGEPDNALDLMVACTLLEHALQQARAAYSKTRSAQAYGGYPAPPVLPAPGF